VPTLARPSGGRAVVYNDDHGPGDYTTIRDATLHRLRSRRARMTPTT
jgi:hypothetical protein